MNALASQYKFVQLNRTFHGIPRDPRQTDEAELSRAFSIGPSLSWDDLLAGHRTIILSEAGSGKTEEIRQVARYLREQKKAAFFLRLEHVPDDLEGAFEVGSIEEFTAWLASNDEGWLLLDSVDEARLRNPSDFERAIRKLGRRIQTAKDRAHILITGRTSAWRAKTDLNLCEQHLPFVLATSVAGPTIVPACEDPESFGGSVISTEQREDAKSEFRVVALDDLSSEQIKTFARARGVEDTKAFLDAIERADAGSFTSRPLDLEELVGFWLDRGRIGTRLELMQNSIERRLRERNQDYADARPLSMARAREGARLIAAATTLGQEPSIQVPDGTHDNNGIILSSVLPDWDDRDHASLLSRPIFDEAIYGTVRFHHRSVREYLTAEWLLKLLARPSSRRTVDLLLFRNQYGVDVVVPTMRPILPWLAILDNRVRESLRRIAPEVLFEGGDPSALPLETRKAVLAEVCEQIASGTSGRSALDYAAVQRFASRDLVEEIRRLLKQYATNDELQAFLLRMIWLGQLPELLQEARAVALSPSASMYTRIAAIRAVKAVGSVHDHEELRNSFLAEAPTLDRAWLSELIADSVASTDTLAWLFAALDKVEEQERHRVDALTDSVADFVANASLDLLPQLVAGLNRLLERPPLVERRYCEVSSRNMWLMKPAAVAIDRLIRNKRREALSDECLDVLHKFRAAQRWATDVEEIKVDFAKLLPAWPELNRAALWYDVHKMRILHTKRGSRLTSYWQASHFGSFWDFASADFDYLANAVVTLIDQDDKLVALSLAYEVYAKDGRPRLWRERLKRIVEGNAELKERLSNLLRPSKNEDAAEAGAWKKRTRARAKRAKIGHEKSKIYIRQHVHALRNPGLPEASDISRPQWYLHERLREKTSNSNRWTEGRWRELTAEYGEEVAQAYRDGVVAYWRKYKPQLRSEGATPNSVPISVIFGLTGLDIEAAETVDWPSNLTSEEILLACRYAAHELNGFPKWFPILFKARRELVCSFLLQEIEYELLVEDPNSETHYVLSDIAWSGQWAWEHLAPTIFRILERRDVANSNNLDKLLTIIQGATVIFDADLARLAERKASSATLGQHSATWFAVWVGVEPNRAIPALHVRLKAIASDEEQKAFAMAFVTNLFRDRHAFAGNVRSAFHSPGYLKDLYLLMHTYIRRSEDLDRAGGGAYSPGLRDHAQFARNALFEQLDKISGKEAYLALDEIAKVHPEEAARPWFLSYAKKKAEQDADMQPWSAAQVREFHDHLDRTPTNHRDLADLAVLRLLDMQDDLENGDTSVAEILLKVTEETVIRNYLAHELREKAFGRYVIPQEEELADARRPDLRFHGVGFDAPVPVEIKLADKWTGPELFERLENQLCGDYLRDRRSTRGIFVLVYRGTKLGWDIPGSANRVDFNGLVDALRSRWSFLADQYTWIDEISVVGISLTERSRKRCSPM